MWKVYLVEFITVVIVSLVWVRGIHKMMDEHPEYDGNDFLDWDDNKNHTEGSI